MHMTTQVYNSGASTDSHLIPIHPPSSSKLNAEANPPGSNLNLYAFQVTKIAFHTKRVHTGGCGAT